MLYFDIATMVLANAWACASRGSSLVFQKLDTKFFSNADGKPGCHGFIDALKPL
jgi:hypothetical protein